MLFDTHSHLYFDNLVPHEDAVIARMKEYWVISVQIGCNLDSTIKSIALSRKYPWILWATAGFHPTDIQDFKTFHFADHDLLISSHRDQENPTPIEYWVLETFEKLIIDNPDQIVAIGECGFDFHHLDPVQSEIQKKNQYSWWLMQKEIADKYSLPMIIHTREARQATYDFIRDNDVSRAVMHCYSEDWEFAESLLELSEDIMFSFSGILTYKNSPLIQEAAKRLPLDRIMIETDAPFLSPQVVRGTTNEPANVRFVLEKLCELRTESPDEIAQGVYDNGKRFYWLC